MSFLDTQLSEEVLNGSFFVLDPEDEDGELNISLPNIRIGLRVVQTAYVSVKFEREDFCGYKCVNESA